MLAKILFSVNPIPNTARSSLQRPLTLWLFKDGKPGHESQIEGLVTALNKVHCLSVHSLSIDDGLCLFLLKLKCLSAKFWPWKNMPPPDLLIGAGHKTHLWLLLARALFGGKTVVLMRPSLPSLLFDLLLIPSHDCEDSSGLSTRSNVWVTRGVLNKVQYSNDSLLNRGLILVGGPSKHFHWDDESVFQQIVSLIEANPRIQWELSSSRRSTRTIVERLKALSYPNFQFTAFSDTDSSWVQTRMKIASRIWVTADSVSMLYEAMTSGGEVGLISLRAQRTNSRICKCVQALVDGASLQLDPSLDLEVLQSHPYLNEAERCALKIKDKWFSNGRTSEG